MLTGGKRNDITQLIPLVNAIPSIRGRRGRPRRRPGELFADRGYHFDSYRRQLRARGITPRIARHGVAHSSGAGQEALGGRTRLRLAARLQATAHPL